jgi:hypothetical protein
VLSLTAAVDTSLVPGFVPGDGGSVDQGPPLAVTALLTAPDGTQRVLRMPDLDLDGKPHDLSAPLPPGLAGVAGVRLAALQVDAPADEFGIVRSTLDVRAITTDGRPAAAARRAWQSRPLVGAGDATEAVAGAGGTVVRVSATLYGTGLVTIRLTPDAPAPPRAVPAVLDAGLAERLGVGPGAALDADVAGRAVRLQIEALAPDGIPGGLADGLDDDGIVPARPVPGVLVDLATLAAVTRTGIAPAVPDPTTWWARTDSAAQARAVAAGVRASGPDAATLVRADVTERRVADPFATGLRRVLVLAALAALAVALGALLLGDVIAASARRTELVVLRAVGVSSAQLRRLLLLERAVVGGTALLAGLLLGVAVAPVLVPAFVGVPVLPGLGAAFDVPAIALAAVLLAAAVLAGAVAAAGRAARLRPAVVLREDAG